MVSSECARPDISSVLLPPNRTWSVVGSTTYYCRLVARPGSVLSGVLPLGAGRSIEGGELTGSLRGLIWDTSCRLKGLEKMVAIVESGSLSAYRPAISDVLSTEWNLDTWPWRSCLMRRAYLFGVHEARRRVCLGTCQSGRQVD